MSAFFRKLQHDTDFLRLILGFLHLLETIRNFIELNTVYENAAMYSFV